jgi:hypothetical protein
VWTVGIAGISKRDARTTEVTPAAATALRHTTRTNSGHRASRSIQNPWRRAVSPGSGRSSHVSL